MAARTYWLDLFTGTTWQEFLAAGGEVNGFRRSRWNLVKKIRPGDYLLCYLTGVSRFIAILEVTSEPFQDDSPIWRDAVFPCRIKTRPVVTLTPETAVPIHELRNRLTIFENMSSPHAWTGRLRGSPTRWDPRDGLAILGALQEAEANPVRRPVDPRKLARRPRGLKAKGIGPVAIPDATDDELPPLPKPPDEATAHTKIQHLLLKLGSAMGFRVWVARNDQNRSVDGRSFAESFNLLPSLPVKFDEATTKTIEYIDVLWLDANAIVAAFEVESTTSIYSGLLRMADLLAMQPNLNIPLYLVAPDERRDRVFVEVNRPTFTRLSPPLSAVCRYISFSALKESMEDMASVLRFLKPEYLDELSEPCQLDED